MFNSLTGTITGKSAQKLLLDTHGIEWEIAVPAGTLDAIPPVGSKGRVLVWMQHTDSIMALFGFASETERSVFFDLLKVDGIGPKGALKIMSSISAADLSQIIGHGDVDALKKVPGVGAKTAAKILLQLKGKLYTVQPLAESASEKKQLPYADVVSALAGMGYERKAAEDAVAKVSAELAADQEFSRLSQNQKEDAVFRSSVMELAR
ncbi:MAG: Holliday junction branch migration protein RuvA [Treponema sp.]|nr:Holliday junction branch migration protein RuvA [Treponema sp.]